MKQETYNKENLYNDVEWLKDFGVNETDARQLIIGLLNKQPSEELKK